MTRAEAMNSAYVLINSTMNYVLIKTKLHADDSKFKFNFFRNRENVYMLIAVVELSTNAFRLDILSRLRM